jgi:putative FmdB family regulatory protein
MPTYEYVCQKCDHQFELVQSIKDEPLAICPKDLCPQKRWAKGKVKKLIGAGGGLLFKGSGFYITDYRSEKYKEAAKKDSAAGSSAGGDAKPAPASGDSKSPKSEAKAPAKASKPSSAK